MNRANIVDNGLKIISLFWFIIVALIVASVPLFVAAFVSAIAWTITPVLGVITAAVCVGLIITSIATAYEKGIY